jgi:hypothetical protein
LNAVFPFFDRFFPVFPSLEGAKTMMPFCKVFYECFIPAYLFSHLYSAHPINPVDASVPGQQYMVCCRNLFLTPITPILGMQHLCCLCEIQAHPTNPVEMYALVAV